MKTPCEPLTSAMHILNPVPVCPSYLQVFQASLTKAQRYKVKNSPFSFPFPEHESSPLPPVQVACRLLLCFVLGNSRAASLSRGPGRFPGCHDSKFTSHILSQGAYAVFGKKSNPAAPCLFFPHKKN